MGRRSQARHLAQVARSFRNGPSRTRHARGPQKATIQVRVDRARLGTHADQEHFALKLGLLRALRLACPETDIFVEDFNDASDSTEPVAVTVYDSTKTMRNRAVRVVERSVEGGTWRAFARRSGEAVAPSMIDGCETPQVAVISASGSDDGRIRARRIRDAHASRAASSSQSPPPST